jgi:hypothetical protein
VHLCCSGVRGMAISENRKLEASFSVAHLLAVASQYSNCFRASGAACTRARPVATCVLMGGTGPRVHRIGVDVSFIGIRLLIIDGHRWQCARSYGPSLRFALLAHGICPRPQAADPSTAAIEISISHHMSSTCSQLPSCRYHWTAKLDGSSSAILRPDPYTPQRHSTSSRAMGGAHSQGSMQPLDEDGWEEDQAPDPSRYNGNAPTASAPRSRSVVPPMQTPAVQSRDLGATGVTADRRLPATGSMFSYVKARVKAVAKSELQRLLFGRRRRRRRPRPPRNGYCGHGHGGYGGCGGGYYGRPPPAYGGGYGYYGPPPPGCY